VITYPCSHCGEIVSLDQVDWIDSGTTLFCPVCDRPTVVDLRPAAKHKADVAAPDEVGSDNNIYDLDRVLADFDTKPPDHDCSDTELPAEVDPATYEFEKGIGNDDYILRMLKEYCLI